MPSRRRASSTGHIQKQKEIKLTLKPEAISVALKVMLHKTIRNDDF